MKKSVYLSKAAAGLKTLASDDPTRCIRNLHVTEEYTEATNGHVMLRVPHMPEPSDELLSEGEEIPPKGLLVDPEQVDVAMRSAGKRQKYVCVSKQPGNKVRTEAINDTRSARFEQEEENALFPHTDMVLPKREHWAEFYTMTLSFKELKNLVDWAAKYGDKQQPDFRFYVQSPNLHVRVEIRQEDESWATGVIMPLRDYVEMPAADNEEEKAA
jgi:hypothetical protein